MGCRRVVAAMVLVVIASGACGSVADTGTHSAGPTDPGPLPAANASDSAPSASDPGAVSASSTPSLPPAHVLATIPIPGNPNGMLEAFGSVWVTSRHTGYVYRIDPASTEVTAQIAVGAEPSYLASDGTALWVVESGADALARIDPRTNAVQTVVMGPAQFDGPTIAFGGGAIWAATEAPSVVKVDPATLKVAGTIDLPGPGDTEESEPEVAFAGGSLWVMRRSGSGDVAGIRRYDPRTLKLTDRILPDRRLTVLGLGVANDSVWVRDGVDLGPGGLIVKLDARSGRSLGSFPLAPNFSGVNLTGGSLWATQIYPLAFAQLDTQSGRAGALEALPSATTYALWFLERGQHDLWISDWDNNVVYRVDPAS